MSTESQRQTVQFQLDVYPNGGFICEEIAQELDRIGHTEDGHTNFVDAVVKAARAKNSILHNALPWDDRLAAELGRRVVAQSLIEAQLDSSGTRPRYSYSPTMDCYFNTSEYLSYFENLTEKESRSKLILVKPNTAPAARNEVITKIDAEMESEV